MRIDANRKAASEKKTADAKVLEDKAAELNAVKERVAQGKDSSAAKDTMTENIATGGKATRKLPPRMGKDEFVEKTDPGKPTSAPDASTREKGAHKEELDKATEVKG